MPTRVSASALADGVASLKTAIGDVLDQARPELIAFGQDIFDHAELGFREERTAGRVADQLRGLGLEVQTGLAMTGVKAHLRGATPGPSVCVMGELDGLPVVDHPQYNASAGAAHACGHNAQLTHIVGAARALVEANAAGHLAGNVVFIAVPAEEYVDLDWRTEQALAGRLEFLGGKPELLRLGALDDVDMVMLVHANSFPGATPFSFGSSSNGFVAKRVRFIGRGAHAARPHLGVNALNAATLALQAMHMQRETFRDEDHVRVHPILTRGGSAVNVVPSDVRLETFVRAATFEAIQEADAKVDRALRAGAMAVGATVEIDTTPGYLPLIGNPELAELFERNASVLVGGEGISHRGAIAASTDAGDLSHVMPVLHPSHGGCSGTMHGADFQVVDPLVAYVNPAKVLAWTVVDLLTGEAAAAKRVLEQFKPVFSRDEYLSRVRAQVRTERFGGSKASS
jgi:amidohydrolase